MVFSSFFFLVMLRWFQFEALRKKKMAYTEGQKKFWMGGVGGGGVEEGGDSERG